MYMLVIFMLKRVVNKVGENHRKDSACIIP